MDIENINDIESESAVIATLIHHPDFVFYSEHLLPEHFYDIDNHYTYAAIKSLAQQGITKIDPLNIKKNLSSELSTREYGEKVSVDDLEDLIYMSDGMARHTVEEYQLYVNNVLNAAFRREALQKLKKCQSIIAKGTHEDIEQKIYETIDDVVAKFSVTNEIPQYKDVVDDYWEEIVERQQNGYPGIPFKMKHLNDYVTMEKGELILFGAGPKQGKSMMLLNCAVDLLRKGYSVLYLDSELSSRLFTARIISHLTEIKYKDVISGNYSDEEKKIIDEKREWLKTRKFTHIYLPIFDKQGVYAAIKKVSHTQGIDVLVIDYFKGADEGDAFDIYRDLGGIVNMIKNQICGAMEIAGIGAIQTTDTGKVADSKRIVRNASTIIMIEEKTPEEQEEDGRECGNKKMIVKWNRNGMQHAPGEYIDLEFNGDLISYEEAEKQHTPVHPF